MEKLRCKICGHKWIPRSENPNLCPKCKSTRWNDESISKTFVRKKIKEEILELLKNGPMFHREINQKLNYEHPIIRFILMEMAYRDEGIVNNLELYRKPTKTRKGIASQRYVLKEMQMKTPLLNLKKCNSCEGYGITRTIIGNYYWANECLLCGAISDKTFDEELKVNHDKWTKQLKELTEKIKQEGVEAVFGDISKLKM